MKDMIYIDLDNVYSNMSSRNDVDENDITKRILWSFNRVKKQLNFNGYVKTYGNQEYLNERIDIEPYKINDNIFVDTPYVNRHGKTCADGLIIAEMFRDFDYVERFIIFTSDVDFYPICDLLVEAGKEVVVVSHGFANGLLKKHCTDFVPIHPYGLYWKNVKNSKFYHPKFKRLIRDKGEFD